MRGGFHGKHDLAFDVGEFPDLLHHEVITRAVYAQYMLGKLYLMGQGVESRKDLMSKTNSTRW